MKVAFFTVFFLEHGGGLAKYFIETSFNLSKLPSVKADVVTMDDKFALTIMRLTHIFYLSFVSKMDMSLIYKESKKNIEKNLGDAGYYKVASIKALRKKLQEYDVIYSKNEVLEAFILKFLVGYENLPPVIFGCHTPFYYPETKSLQSKLHNFLYNGFIYRFLASDVKAFHVLNSSDEQELRRLMPAKKIVKIYNALDYKTNSVRRNSKFNHNWNKNKINILWIGRLAEGKGVPDLLSVIDYLNLREYENQVVFNIIGDGSKVLREKIIKSAKRWNNVNYMGFVEHRYVQSIYKENDLFICTSKWETFSYSVLEAQAAGLPVIAFNMPAGPRDIIEQNKTGFLVSSNKEFAKKIIQISRNKGIFKSELIKEITKARFDPGRIYKRLHKVLSDIARVKLI